MEGAATAEVGMNLARLRNKKLSLWRILSGQKYGGIGRRGFVDHVGPCSRCKELDFV